MTNQRPTNLGALHDDYTTLRPDRVALIDGEDDRRITYGEFAESVARAGNALEELGVGREDRIALFFPNELTYVYTFFGAIRIGAVPVPVNVQAPAGTIEYVVEDCDASLIVTSASPEVRERADDAAAAVDGIETLAVADASPDPHGGDVAVVSFERATAGADPERSPVAVDPDDPALQPYTSGSTGRPKGVVLSHGGTRWNTDVVRKTMMYDEDDRGLVAAPLYHKNAMIAMIKPLLTAGGGTVVLPGFDAAEVIGAIDRYGVTILTGVPAMYEMLLDSEALAAHDVSTVQLARCGSDSVPESLMDRFEDVFEAPLVEMFGITEGGPAVTCSPRWGGPRKLGSAGVPYPGVETLIVDPASGEELPTGESGELLVSNPGLGTYYERPDKQAEAFEERDGRTFLHTEDVAYVDEDGYHYIVGRLDDMMIVGGRNLYPAEVETVLTDHPAVDEVIVVSAPHSTKGEAPVAFVIRGSGAAAPDENADTDVTEEDLQEFAIEHGPAYAHPRRVFFLEEFPLSGAGKIDRDALEADARDRIDGEL